METHFFSKINIYNMLNTYNTFYLFILKFVL